MAAIVGTDGQVKATQPTKDSNLKPFQIRRKEITFRMAVPSISDSVGFAISEIQRPDGEPWRVSDAALENILGEAGKARRR